MKAFLLAAGLGSRLRPLTNGIPKCLLPIDGVPLLSIWTSICEKHGITDVLINTHHLAEQVRRWAEGQGSAVRIRLTYERRLLGSAGTVRENWDFVAAEEDFFIFYADNLISYDLGRMLTLHRSHSAPLTVLLFATHYPEQCGIAELDAEGRVGEFVEKPARPKSNLASAGIYIARQKLRQFLPAQTPSDFGHDVLPRLVGEARGIVLDGYQRDIGTPDSYERAQVEWRSYQQALTARGGWQAQRKTRFG